MALQVCLAARKALSERSRIEDITAASFEIPLLGEKLRELRGDVLRGRGFAVIRGLPVERMSLE